MRKTKILPFILACVVLCGFVGYLIIGNPIVFINNQKLKNSITAIDNQTVQLNDVIPFEWDTLYTFEPYTSKETIEDIIGFKSRAIKDNGFNEGMLHLLFVKDGKVVASVLGYSSNLNYSIDFTAKEELKVTYAEAVKFEVTKTNEVTVLTYIESEETNYDKDKELVGVGTIVSYQFPTYTEEELQRIADGHEAGSFDMTDTINTFLDKFNRDNLVAGINAKNENGFEKIVISESQDAAEILVSCDDSNNSLLVMMELKSYENVSGLWQVVAYQIIDNDTAVNLQENSK